MSAPLLEVRGLHTSFPVRGGRGERVHAVNGVDLRLDRGETLGLVGESGSGKSTTGRSVLRLVEPDRGTILFDGMDVLAMDRRALRQFRRRAQFVFQDPFSALNPRLTVGSMLEEVLQVHQIGTGTADRRTRAGALLERVGLDADVVRRFPHEFSGGQRQRLGIARALAVEPELLILDEPVSALDVSIQAQIVNLLRELQRSQGLAYLFIAHDLGLVQHLSHRVAVMYLGRIMESAPTEQLFQNPRHPYTQALLAAIPGRGGEMSGGAETGAPRLQGETPSPIHLPSGCPFCSRCPHPERDAACSAAIPELSEVDPGQFVACVKVPSDTEIRP